MLLLGAQAPPAQLCWPGKSQDRVAHVPRGLGRLLPSPPEQKDFVPTVRRCKGLLHSFCKNNLSPAFCHLDSAGRVALRK